MQSCRSNEGDFSIGAPTGTQGNVINTGVNELILPNNKQTWANIRKISSLISPNHGIRC